jgi:beta-lactamase regulating signal transducer with metallopeptidase domain
MAVQLPISSRVSLFNWFRLPAESAQYVSTTIEHSTAAWESAASMSQAEAAASALTASQIASAVLFFVWIAGIALVLGYGICSYVKCRRQVRTAVIRQRETPSQSEVWECDGIPSPFVFGIACPRIYIPFGLDEQERRYILAHEQCHIRRHDPLWRLLAFALLAVYWCNPLAWVAFFCMTRDMEMSCDEAVIESFGSESKKGYSELLLAFAMERRPYSFAPVAFGEGDAERRIQNVLNFKKPQTWVAAVAMVLLVVAAVSCLTNALQKTVDAQELAHMTTENNGSYSAIVWDGRTYVPYTVISKNECGAQIGIVNDDENDKVYEYEGYSTDLWIVELYVSGLMDNPMLLREINVTEIPEGLQSEYEWNP